jgi:2-isopropylmalate synthase
MISGLAAKTKVSISWQASEIPQPIVSGDSGCTGRGRAAVSVAGYQSVAASVGSIMKAEHGLSLPPELQIEFSKAVQGCPDIDRNAICAEQIWDIFNAEYLLRELASALLIRCTARRADMSLADPWIGLYMIRQSIHRPEDDPSSAFAETLTAMGVRVNILDRYAQLVETSGQTAVYLRCMVSSPVWGVGIAGDVATATLKALLSAVNRADRMLFSGISYRIGGDRTWRPGRAPAGV